MGGVIITPPSGYHIEIVLSVQISSGGGNSCSIDINGAASVRGSTWWGETFLPSFRSGYTRLDSIPLEPAQPYDNSTSMGLNLYVRNTQAGQRATARNITAHGYLVAD